MKTFARPTKHERQFERLYLPKICRRYNKKEADDTVEREFVV
jgi:hypothetical protein